MAKEMDFTANDHSRGVTCNWFNVRRATPTPSRRKPCMNRRSAGVLVQLTMQTSRAIMPPAFTNTNMRSNLSSISIRLFVLSSLDTKHQCFAPASYSQEQLHQDLVVLDA